jgi:curved DNA-binding protein CbpA
MCQHRAVAPTLYDVLGTSPDASGDELRRAYYRGARLSHPDLHPGCDASEPMRRLNAAWTVLGDPDQRRRYDARQGISRAAAPEALRVVRHPREGPQATTSHPLARLIRPAVIIPAVLTLIFVATAYAGPLGASSRPSGQTPPSSEAPRPEVGGGARGVLFGQCIEPQLGYDAVVPCQQPSAGIVVADVTSRSQCPLGTTSYQLIGQPQLVCLRPVARR